MRSSNAPTAMTHNKIDMAICLLLALLAIGCATPMATLHPDVKSYTDIHPVRPNNKRSLSNIDSISGYRYTKPPKRATATMWTATAKYNNQGAMLRTKRHTIVSNKRDTAYNITSEENFFNDKGQLVRYEKRAADTLFLVQTFVYNKRGQLIETTKQYQPTEYFIAEKWCYSYDRHGNERSSEFYQNEVLKHRSYTRYNHKGHPLTKASYRGDGVLLDSTIYTYNRYGDIVEERSIVEQDRNILRNDKTSCIFDAENHYQQRHIWQNRHKSHFGWGPILYDTIGTRYSYHSKDKQTLVQVWWSEWGEEWRDYKLTVYNPDGGVAEKWQYYTYEHNGKPYKREVYNSQGLLTSLYEHNGNCDSLTLKMRNEYNEQGVLIRQIEYDTFYSKEVHEVYNDRGDLIEYWQMTSNGKLQLVRKEKYEYTDIDEGKSVTTVRNGKTIPSPIQSVTTIERERLADGGTSEIKTTYHYDKSGNIISIIIHKRVDSPTYMLSWAKYYEGSEMTIENLLTESREEFFFRPEE